MFIIAILYGLLFVLRKQNVSITAEEGRSLNLSFPLVVYFNLFGNMAFLRIWAGYKDCWNNKMHFVGVLLAFNKKLYWKWYVLFAWLPSCVIIKMNFVIIADQDLLIVQNMVKFTKSTKDMCLLYGSHIASLLKWILWL